MKKLWIAGGVLAALIAGSGLLGIGNAGGQAVVGNEFTVIKVVEGPAPDGAVFVVDVVCESQLGGGGGSPEGAVVMEFDETGAPLNDNTIVVPAGITCTATETVTNGAAVTYACEESGPVPNSPDEGLLSNCVGDQTVEFTDIVGATGTITVTNTFEEPPPDVEPDVVVIPDVVTATPPFTG